MSHIEVRPLGRRKQQPVTCAVIPRDLWVDLVANEIQETPDPLLRARLHDLLMPIARSMTHYPMNVWVHDERGCGCLVGEHLIAQDAIAVENESQHGTVIVGEILQRLYGKELSLHLVNIGLAVNESVEELVDEQFDLNTFAEWYNATERAVVFADSAPDDDEHEDQRADVEGADADQPDEAVVTAQMYRRTDMMSER